MYENCNTIAEVSFSLSYQASTFVDLIYISMDRNPFVSFGFLNIFEWQHGPLFHLNTACDIDFNCENAKYLKMKNHFSIYN